MSNAVPLADSVWPLPAGAQPFEEGTPLDRDAPLEVTVYLRTDPSTTPEIDPAQEAEKDPVDRRYLSAAEVEAQYGAAPAEFDAAAAWARSAGFEIVRANRTARSLRLRGSAGTLAEAFGLDLRMVALADTTFHTHVDPIQIPAEIAPYVEAVFGFDNRPMGRSFHRPAAPALQRSIAAWHDAGGPEANISTPAGSFLPPQVATLYDFPTQAATGQTVAVFAFNDPSTPGGYETSILETYFTKDLGLPTPEITDVTIQGPGNTPGPGTNPDDASPEVYLDLSIVGSLASGAKIVVYFSEFTEHGWVDALTEASTDATNDPGVISISYGNPEDGSGSAWTAAAVTQVNQAFAAAAARGKTITAASGDNGATDGESSGVHVDFPASSPWVLACGGTRLAGSGTTVESETVWNDLAGGNGATGGGISTVFAQPTWQANAQLPVNAASGKPGRGVPDVSSLADPQTPYIVAQPSGTGGVGGTSAAAPLWAALVTRLNATAGAAAVGYLNPKLYSLSENPLRDIIAGNNKAAGGPGYVAGPGWDACTGWGSPGAGALDAALKQTG